MTAPEELFGALVIEGPLPVTEDSVPFGCAWWPPSELGVDLAAAGYVEEEYRISGLADEFGYDEAGRAVVSHPAIAYATRLLIRRPADRSRFSGVVHLEPNHSDADRSISWGALAPWILRAGHAHVGVTQEASVIGDLQRWDPARYGSLSIPGAGLGWDIVGQTAALVRSFRPLNPFATTGTARLYLSGWSRTGTFCRTFLGEGFHERWRRLGGRPAIDGYVICISSGGALRAGYAELSPGQPTLAADDERRTIGGHGVPVIELLSEGEAETHRGVLRPDADTATDRYRLYEVAGSAHVATGNTGLVTNQAQLTARGWPLLTREIEQQPSTARLDYVARAVFSALDDWVARGTAPGHATRFDYLARRDAGHHGLMDEALPLVRDAAGNVIGGVRTPWIDVPRAAYLPHSTARTGSCVPSGAAPYSDPSFMADLIGHMVPFEASELQERYGTEAGYRARFSQRCDELVAEGWLLVPEADRLQGELEEHLAWAD